jgi:hypothetical protein
MKKMSLLWMFLLVCFLVFTLLFFTTMSLRNKQETFRNQNRMLGDSSYPFTSEGRLLNQFPSTNEKTVTSNQYNDVWFYYPSFGVGSFDQRTNNVRYVKNPDEGTSIGAEFSGAMYKDKPKSDRICNEVFPLPPVPNQRGLRVNYYHTANNLFLSDQPGLDCPLPAF